MIDIKDEVLDTSLQPDNNPRYTIKDNNGKVINDNVQIDLKTPVVEEGTPLNKALVKDLRKLYVSYNKNADIYYGTEEERVFEKEDLVIQDTVTKKIKKGVWSKLYQSSLVADGVYSNTESSFNIVDNYYVVPAFDFTNDKITLSLYLRDWKKGKDTLIGSTVTSMPLTSATQQSGFYFAYLGNNEFGMIYTLNNGNNSSSKNFFVNKYQFTNNSLTCYEQFTSSNIANYAIALMAISKVQDNKYLTCWHQKINTTDGRDKQIVCCVYDFDTNFVSNYVITDAISTPYYHFYQVEDAGIYNNSRYFVIVAEWRRTTGEADPELFVASVNLNDFSLTFDTTVRFSTNSENDDVKPGITEIINGEFYYIRASSDKKGLQRCVLDYNNRTISGSGELSLTLNMGSNYDAGIIYKNGIVYYTTGVAVNMYAYDTNSNAMVQKGSVSYADEIVVGVLHNLNGFRKIDENNYLIASNSTSSNYGLIMHIEADGIPTIKRLFPYENTYNNDLRFAISQNGKYFLINSYFAYQEYYLTETEKVFGIVDEVRDDLLIIQRYGERNADIDTIGIVYRTPLGYSDKGMFAVGANNSNVTVELDLL